MRYVIAFVLALAMALVATALPSLPPPPAAQLQRGADDDLVWRNGTFTLRLTQRPCRFKEFSDDLEEVGIPPAKATVLLQTGRPTLVGCWAPDIGGDVLTRDIGGNGGMVPGSWFQRVPRS